VARGRNKGYSSPGESYYLRFFTQYLIQLFLGKSTSSHAFLQIINKCQKPGLGIFEKFPANSHANFINSKYKDIKLFPAGARNGLPQTCPTKPERSRISLIYAEVLPVRKGFPQITLIYAEKCAMGPRALSCSLKGGPTALTPFKRELSKTMEEPARLPRFFIGAGPL